MTSETRHCIKNLPLILICMFVGCITSCGPAHQKSSSHAASGAEGSSFYEQYLEQGRFEDALTLTCKRYSLDCASVYFSKSGIGQRYASTSPVTNSVTVGQSAFYYRYKASQAWLAAVVAHENIHQQQSLYIRGVVNGAQQRIGNYIYEAGLELEAWSTMRDRATEFGLNCMMLLEIEDNIYDFNQILENNGRRSPDGMYPLPTEHAQRIFRDCARAQN